MGPGLLTVSSDLTTRMSSLGLQQAASSSLQHQKAADAQDPHCVVVAVAFAAAATHDDDNDPCDSLHACLH